MANQIAIAGTIAGVSEALAYAARAGLDTQKMLDSISKGAAGSWQMENLMPKMMREDYAPGFFLSLIHIFLIHACQTSVCGCAKLTHC